MTASASVTSTFDAFALAAGAGELSGCVDARTLARLADRFTPEAESGDCPAQVTWQIHGGHDELGRPMLVVALGGTLPLQCQRCLDALCWAIENETQVLLAADEAELARLDEEDVEVVLADHPLAWRDLIEDELVLSAPYVPRHEECSAAIAPTAAEAPAPSAFAKLAHLKKT